MKQQETPPKTISRAVYERAMTSGEAPEGCHFLAVATNMDDRPCGWGKAKLLADAKAEADRQYANHNCYPGEVRKPSYEVSIVDDAPVDRWPTMDWGAEIEDDQQPV